MFGAVPTSITHADDAFCFVTIARAGSLAGAALRLGVPASTLSRRLAALEERLGVRLIERTTRSLRLTEIGEIYLERCAPMVQALGEADALASSYGAAPRGVLRITAPPVLGVVCLGSLLALYTDRNPGVRVEVILTERAMNLSHDRFDVGLRLGLPPSGPSDQIRRLGLSPRMLCASASYVQRRGRPRSVETFDHHVLVGLATTGAEPTWSFAGVRHPIEPRVRVNNSMLARELCRQGVGLALLPAFLARPDIASGRLLEVTLEVAADPAEVVLLLSATAARTSKVRALVNLVQSLPPEAAPWR